MLSLFWRFNSFWRLLQVFLVSEGLYKGLVNEGELNALSKKELNMIVFFRWESHEWGTALQKNGELRVIILNIPTQADLLAFLSCVNET